LLLSFFFDIFRIPIADQFTGGVFGKIRPFVQVKTDVSERRGGEGFKLAVQQLHKSFQARVVGDDHHPLQAVIQFTELFDEFMNLPHIKTIDIRDFLIKMADLGNDFGCLAGAQRGGGQNNLRD